jgi:hypothetical protein
MSTATQFLTDANGEKIAAVIPITEYEELLEDLNDLAVFAERRDESRFSLAENQPELRKPNRLAGSAHAPFSGEIGCHCV